MKTTVWAWGVGLGLASGCVTPSGQASAGGEAQAREVESGLICEEQPVTGSHMARRVCREATEVEQERERTQREVRGANRTNERFGQ